MTTLSHIVATTEHVRRRCLKWLTHVLGKYCLDRKENFDAAEWVDKYGMEIMKTWQSNFKVANGIRPLDPRPHILVAQQIYILSIAFDISYIIV